MSHAGTRSVGRKRFRTPWLMAGLLLPFFLLQLARADVGISVTPPIPGTFDPEADLRAPKPLRLYGADSLAAFSHEGILFRVETEYDSTSGYYVSTRTLFGDKYGPEQVYSPEAWREFRVQRARRENLRKKFDDQINSPSQESGGSALEIQVPFKIRSRTFRRIFGGDRVGLRVTGQITIDGGLRREKSDQVLTTRNDQANYNFKIDQTQQFRIVGKVGDKVSVEIDQDSERIFDFENNVKLSYEGYEDEIIQSIEAGNISLSLPGTQLATLTANNQGLFGFKTESKVGPLSITTIASLQQGEKNKLSYEGGSEATTVKINDTNYLRNQYFFLDFLYREQYRRFTSEVQHVVNSPDTYINQIEVYRSVQPQADNTDIYDGVAVYDESEAENFFVPAIAGADEINEMVDYYKSAGDEEGVFSENAFFRKLDENEYDVDLQAGYIRLSYPANDGEIIAVAYSVGSGANRKTVGTLSPPISRGVFKLLKPKTVSIENPVYQLSWKHVYDLQTSGLKEGDLEARIVRANSDASPTNQTGEAWVQVLGVDQFSNSDETGPPDNQIDERYQNVFVNRAYGELHFPDLRPFDPEGYYKGNELIVADLDSLENPTIYDVLPNSGTTRPKNFNIEATYSSASSNISLGINVLEGSEEVFLNGTKLTKDVDYIIDYLSGQITILNDQAFLPGANLEINYESGEVFQLDQRTMLGIRLEYALWEDSFIGATFLYFNEEPIDKRVKVGNEPLRNIIWDVNTRLRFRPYWMTQLVNALPGIETDEPSEVSFEGEIAQVFPNPNSLNSDATGDPNGVAYIDDFEAAKRATPLGVRRKNWYAASHPNRLPRGDFRSTPEDSTDFRGRLFWYNPFNRVQIKDIWPNREVNTKVPNETEVLTIEYDPNVNNFRRAGVDSTITWNGVMRALSPGFYNQTATKFIEVWLNWQGGGRDATLYFDMGQISEDVIPNGELDTEDEIVGIKGNDILDDGEDSGYDGKFGTDPPWRKDGNERFGDPWIAEEEGYDFQNPTRDWWDLNDDGIHDENEPFSNDDWKYNPGNRGETEYIDGTEGNAQDEVRYPDSEDLNNDNSPNLKDNFYRYRFRLNSAEDSIRYVRGGYQNEKGWRLVRIPLTSVFDNVNRPSLNQIESFRIWITNASTYTTLQIAQIELVGNEWLEEPVVEAASGDTTIFVTSSTINTYDNPNDYNPPPGVAGEVDPITDIRSKEQSLILQLNDMPTGATGKLIKTQGSANDQDLREYRKLKMFVNGGGRSNISGTDIEMFLRFGDRVTDDNPSYYEYSQRLQPGWSDNEIIIDLDQLASLKKKAEEEGTDVAYERLANGDVMKVVGKPSIGAVSEYAIGIRNLGRPIRKEENIEVWVDEMRLSGVRKEAGMAMRSSVSASFADFLDVSANLRQSDANFHQVDQRTGGNESTIDGTMNAKVSIDKFLDPNLGISIPVSGSMSSNLRIPKYAGGNGDIRTTALASQDELNIWNQFGRLGFSRHHLEDHFLEDERGELVMDTTRGVPYQDLSKWGVDTLFTTSQQYSWNISYSKSKESPNWFLAYTTDKLKPQFSHSQKYETSQKNQYSKAFTNTGKLSYSLPFEKHQLDVFGWTSAIPVLNRLQDSKFNYMLSRFSAGVDATEKRTSSKYRNAQVRPSYSLSSTRNFAVGYSPFQSMNFDFSRNWASQYVREDSTRQDYLYKDQPLSQRSLTFEPGTGPYTIIETITDTLRLADRFLGGGPALADSVDQWLADGDEPSDVVTRMYASIERDFPGVPVRQPWEIVPDNDPRYQRIFFEAFGMPFVDTQKSQRFSASYSPSIVRWLTTDASYSTNYNWNWSAFSYTGRNLSSTNTLTGSMTFKLRQILPQRSKSGGRRSSPSTPRRSGGTDPFSPRGPESDSFGEPRPGDSGGQKEEESASGGGMPDVLGFTLDGLRKLQDIRFDYTQNLSYNNPSMKDGEPDWMYKLGLTGRPGLEPVQEERGSYSSVQRTDDYRVNSGFDLGSRASLGLDYNYRLNSSSSPQQTTGGNTRSAFYIYDKGSRSLQTYDLPNYNFRWSGLEAFGPLEIVAQSISVEHSYRGSYTEDWEDVLNIDSERVRQVKTKKYEKAFSPLAGMNITWKYGISTTIRYNESMSINETASNGSRRRDTTTGISFQANYTRKGGFRIPLPIWPFRNRRFNNETTFSLAFDQSNTLKENRSVISDDPNPDFTKESESSNWSVTPSVTYKFSRTVSGSARYKYGVTESQYNTTRYQEFGINVNIKIQG
ncbi:cell surface protein SprA [bacterium]|nr:cell surface protein SprA [bacterium]